MEAWKEWKQNPTTKEFLLLIQHKLDELKEDWVNRQFVTETENAFALGQTDVLARLLEVDFVEDIVSK
jgi:hypothetical protein